MEIASRYKVERCVSTDETRMVLCHLNILESHPEVGGPAIEATDGRHYVAVPVQLNKGDKAGLLRPGILSLARLNSKGLRDTIVIRLRKKWASLLDSTVCKRDATAAGTSYPATHTCKPKNKIPEAVDSIAVNAHYLAHIQDAMGADGVVFDVPWESRRDRSQACQQQCERIRALDADENAGSGTRRLICILGL